METDSRIRMRRLTLRSGRRGLRELDLVLGQFAERQLRRLPLESLTLYEQLLDEEDTCILDWMTGAQPRPAKYEELILRIVDAYQAMSEGRVRAAR